MESFYVSIKAKLFQLAVISAILFSSYVSAVGVPAFENSQAVGNQSYGNSMGLFFDVAAPGIAVLGLGVYDSNQDGFGPSTNLKAQVWQDFGLIKVTVGDELSFTMADPGFLMGTYRFKFFDTPLYLPASTFGPYLINAWGFNNTDMNGNTNLSNPPSITGNTVGGIVSYNDLAQWRNSLPLGGFPDLTASVDNNFQFAAGNVLFAPEPKTYLIIGSLLVTLLLISKRKKRSRV